MKSLISRITLLRMAVVATLAASTSMASATIWNLQASLDGLQETPVNASPGTGFGTLTLDDVTGQVIVTSGTFSGLTATANNAHIHGLAGPGVPAGILIGLSFTAATSGTFSGSGTLNGPNIAGMLAGNTYFNIHSVGQFSGGEIRGQITVVPEPGALALAGLGIIGLAANAWKKRANRA